jgi:hypothetical protein
MERFALLVVVTISTTLLCQKTPPPLTHVDACQKFSSAVVEIDAGGDMKGSGFIVDTDGWILTAAHIVFDRQARKYYRTITVTMPDKSTEFATPVGQINDSMLLRDFAILKINKSKLPFLPLGDEDKILQGSSLTIIGFPFSAIGPLEDSVTTKFCLSGTVAARTTVPIQKINIELVYFQGVSVKGISGSPVISLDTGTVIGIADLKLAGITQALQSAQAALLDPSGGDFITGGVSITKTLGTVIGTLDRHLANGLGAATGINDVKVALASAKRHYKGK